MHANGNSRDRQGRLITCEHLTRPQRLALGRDGTYSVADSYNLRPLVHWSDLLVALASWAIWPIYVGVLVVYGLVRLVGL
jgi:gluconolactonase